MADLAVTVIEVVRTALGTLILAVFLWLLWKTLRLGPDLVTTRAMLQSKRSLRIAILVTLGILFQLVFTGIGLYRTVSAASSGDWEIANKLIEALTLLWFLAALVLFVPIVQVPSSATHPSKEV